jgi:hypothetical protein
VHTLAVDEACRRLSIVTLLLQHTAIAVWSHADQTSPDSPLHSLGLGVYLAHAQTTALLPDGYEFPDVDLQRGTPLQLLIAAEELTRSLPLHRPDLAGGSQLVVDLCDLVREARDLGY